MLSLWETLMEDQIVARCVAVILAWRFLGIPLWHYMLGMPVIGHWLVRIFY